MIRKVLITNSLRMRQDKTKRSDSDWYFETFVQLMFRRELSTESERIEFRKACKAQIIIINYICHRYLESHGLKSQRPVQTDSLSCFRQVVAFHKSTVFCICPFDKS